LRFEKSSIFRGVKKNDFFRKTPKKTIVCFTVHSTEAIYRQRMVCRFLRIRSDNKQVEAQKNKTEFYRKEFGKEKICQRTHVAHKRKIDERMESVDRIGKLKIVSHD
jgi:hypothetical protein